MPQVLVTGANSFVASHVIDILIKLGHHVTGTLRRLTVGDEILREHPEWEGKFKAVEIINLADQSAWEALFKSQEFDFIVHVAAPIVGVAGLDDYDNDWLTPSVEGNLALLRAAKAHAPSLKHISMTGSINAITMGDDLATRTITDADWNSVTQDYARTAKNDFVSYCSIKKESELAVWKFVETEKPAFGVTVILPALIFGPPIQPVKSVAALNFSVGLFYSLWNGQNETIPDTMFPSYVDVRDIAEAHVKALTTPSARNQRFLIGGMPLTNTAMVRAMRSLIAKGELPAELEEKIAKESGEDERTAVPKIVAEPGNTALDMKFKSMEETVRDMTLRILDLRKRE